MSKDICIKKGLDIRLKGFAIPKSVNASHADVYAICPDDFHGMIPQMMVKVGDTVKASDVVFCSKYDPRIRFTSPVSGKIIEVLRAEKRKIVQVLIQSDGYDTCKEYSFSHSPKDLTSDQVREILLESGLWAFLKQRPYDVIPSADAQPKAIFMSGYNTVPLGADYQYTLCARLEDMQAGVDALSKLSGGKFVVGVDGNVSESVFKKLQSVDQYNITGPHPAGNVGVLINHVSPVNKGETVFTIAPEDLAIIGEFFRTGKYNPTRLVAVTGSEVQDPQYVKATIGSSILCLVKDNVKSGSRPRYISGNVLSGRNVGEDGYLNFYDNQVTLIPEGDDDSRFFGWIAPNTDKLSFLHAGTFSWLFPSKEYTLNTNTNGGPRNFVVTGIYEQVFPMDIYPMQLVKAAITKDIEALEQLGIYEVAPEDFALCSFVCPSKIEQQVIIREALDLMIKEIA